MVKLIGVAGGSGSGKTTFAEMLLQHFGSNNATILYQDSYYIDRSDAFTGDGSLNFDHPDAIDWLLMFEQLSDLHAGKTIAVPMYDFVTHNRKPATITMQPKKYVIVDDIKFYIDTNEAMRYQRRLLRDVEERGRTPEGVRIQYEASVRPMHDLFVEPSRVYADQIIIGETRGDMKIPDMLLKGS
jgi:uridine kinase